jgi:hypothetical protein
MLGEDSRIFIGMVLKHDLRIVIGIVLALFWSISLLKKKAAASR